MERENYYSDVEIGKINLSAHNHWEILDLANLKFNKPTVLCFSGNGAINHKLAHGLAKMAESYLDLLFAPKQGYHTLDHVDIMGIKYAQLDKDTGRLSKTAVEQLASAMTALLFDAKGQRLNLEQAKQKMSRIVFFTYCAGNAELTKVIESFNRKLANIGYREDEIYAINRATLEVSYAPQNVVTNKIPSVRVISQNDKVVGSDHFEKFDLGGVINRNQDDNINGIHLHQDTPGTFYGNRSDTAAESIQIISSSLLNSYFDSYAPHERIDEHDIGLTARDQNWSLKPKVIDGVAYQSSNADCVSQMMAWALCKGVENSIQNFKSERYIPNTYWDELMDDLKSIINSYGHDKLAKNPLQQSALRKDSFDTLRARKKFALAKDAKINASIETVARDLGSAKKFKEVMLICEKYNYQHADALLPKLDFLTKEERLILSIAQENKTLPQTNVQASNSDQYTLFKQCEAELDRCDKSFPAVLKIMDRCDYYTGNLLPKMDYLTNAQKATILNLSKIKKSANELKSRYVMQAMQVPTFEEMVNTLNYTKSFEEAVAYLKQNDFFGVEYVLPEVSVLTPAEKNSLLVMAGKQPEMTQQDWGIEL
ncbi:MAG: hypothetical protein IJ295_03140 [Clostridia bacterium]|nr:hypothetical protein [Clostridia bacterium]